MPERVHSLRRRPVVGPLLDGASELLAGLRWRRIQTQLRRMLALTRAADFVVLSCHAGPNFTDGEFHDVRVISSGPFAPHDPSRAEGAKRVKTDPFNLLSPYSDDHSGASADKVSFLATETAAWNQVKTPSLRNVALTAPYMHDGSIATLSEVIDHYARGGRLIASGPDAGDGALNVHKSPFITGFPLGAAAKADLLAFLDSLSDRDFTTDPRFADPFVLQPSPAP